MSRGLLVTVVLLAGCAAPNLAPSNDEFVFIGQQVIPNPDGLVRAFRVDLAWHEDFPSEVTYSISPIKLDDDGVLPIQVCRYHFSTPMRPCREFALRVRLYRPGFRTIELRPGEAKSECQWIPANFDEQEAAVDELLGLSKSAKGDWWKTIVLLPSSQLAVRTPAMTPTLGDIGLLPGYESPKHREALRFAADEYERLAMSSSLTWSARGRVSQKAAQIRRYANLTSPEK